MLWRGQRTSSNVDDRRGIGGGHLVIGGGIIGVIALVVNFLLSGDPSQLNQLLPVDGSQMSAEEQASQDTLAQFVSVVLAQTEDVWPKLLAPEGIQYTDPTLVLFSGYVQSACGNATAASGPFYCPSDQKVYIDLSFYKEMKDRFHAPGDFAEAYVIAHEVGHHVQTLMGITDKVDRMRQTMNETESNQLSVKVELQADFFAGVWAHYERKMGNIIQAGDIEEALNAASAIGDDRLQKETQGYVVPDAFTHGTSAQRVYWFKKGYETGDIHQGNTFAAKDL